jgi:uncharacterized protein (TIRG00374 family)
LASSKPVSIWFRRLVPGLIFGFVIFLGISLFGDLRLVGVQILRFRWALFPLVLALTLFNYLLRWIKFHYYLSQIGAGGLPYRESARLFVAGFPLALTPAKLGEALKGLWIEWKTGQPAARGIAVVVAERISDALALLLLSLFGIIAYPRYWPAFIFLFAVLFGLVALTQIPPLAKFILALVERLPLLCRLAHPIHQFYQGSLHLFRPTALLAAVGLGAVSWLGEGVGFYLILLGLGFPPSLQTFSILVFILAFSTVIGGASALPGGLGAADASITGMLVLLLKLPLGTAVTAALLIRFATLWFGVSLGLIVWLFSADLLTLGHAHDQPAAG